MRDIPDDKRSSSNDEDRRFDEGGAGARQGHEGNFSEGWDAGYSHGYKDGYDHGSTGRPYQGNASEARHRQAADPTAGDESRGDIVEPPARP